MDRIEKYTAAVAAAVAKIPSPFRKEYLVPVLATVYAAISVQNIAHFFQSLGHDGAISWTAGFAIGATLVILAHYLAETPMSDKAAFRGLLGVTLVFVALTTIVQGDNYFDALGWWGYLFALVLAGAGELALPLAYAVAENAKRRREVTEAGQQAERIAAETVLQVMKDLDVARAQKQAERRIEKLIVAHVDATVTKLMPTVKPDAPAPAQTAQEAPHGVTPATADIDTNSTPSVTQRPIDNAETTDFVQQMADGKRNKSAERRTQLLHILQSEFDGQDAERLNKTALAGRLDTTRQTIARDLSTLQDKGFVNLNGTVKVVSA